MSEGMTLTAEQVEALDDLDAALCNFLNAASDEFDPRLWIPETKRNFKALARAYNECHVLNILDIQRGRPPHQKDNTNDQ